MGERIHQLIKNSQLIVINDARHGIHLTHAEELTKLIIEFI
jgi:pimeloyl-ACP methyl ester carboxylesterase